MPDFISPVITFVSNLFLTLIKKHKRVSIVILILGALFLICYFVFVSRTEVRFKLQAQNNELASGASTFINAELSNKNGPIEGKNIKFVLTENNSGGYLSPTTATTDLNGKARVSYYAGKNSDTIDQIKAMYNDIPIKVNITVLKKMTLNLSAKSHLTAATGSIEITAKIVDQKGTPVENENVSFKIINNNSYASLDSNNKLTDRNGIATVIYTAGNEGNSKDIVEASIKNSSSRQISIEVSQLVGLLNAYFQYFPDTAHLSKDIESATNTFVSLELINLNNQAIKDAVFGFATVSYLQYKGKAVSPKVNRFEIGELAPGQPQYLSIWFDKDKRHWISGYVSDQEELIEKIKPLLHIWWGGGNPGSCIFYSIHSDDGKRLNKRYSKIK